MGVHRYPDEVHEFVKKWMNKLGDRELAMFCNDTLCTNFTTSGMKAFRGNHGYRHKGPRQKCDEYWIYQDRYPQGMYEFIRDNSTGIGSEAMAEMVNEKFGMDWTATRMKQFRGRHGISSGLTGHFEKGHVPDNKGKKLEEIITDPKRLEEVRRKMAATPFKKGDTPVNELPAGAIVATTDGYLLIKKQMDGEQWDRWELLHRSVWEQHNGPVPDGMIISFKDGNKENCDIRNLMLISKSENALLNTSGYRSKDPDLTETGLNLIRLKNAAKNARRNDE